MAKDTHAALYNNHRSMLSPVLGPLTLTSTAF